MIESHLEALRALAQRHGVRSIKGLGSMARDDADAVSDVGLLVENAPEPSGFALGALLMDAQDLLGRRVNVVTEQSLPRCCATASSAKRSLCDPRRMKPSPEADKVYLAHRLAYADPVEEWGGGDEACFRASRLIQGAAVRNRQTPAESSQRLTDAIKASAPEVPWRAISGFRNILVHDYLAIDVDAVWLVVDQALPRLRVAPQRMATGFRVA